jgi:fatty acid-binding protein DegV
MKAKGSELENYKVFILQADCEKAAETFANTIRETFGDLDIDIQPVGPVIGAHCGPGTIGLIFHAKEK